MLKEIIVRICESDTGTLATRSSSGVEQWIVAPLVDGSIPSFEKQKTQKTQKHKKLIISN